MKEEIAKNDTHKLLRDNHGNFFIVRYGISHRQPDFAGDSPWEEYEWQGDPEPISEEEAKKTFGDF